jgi:hypothetical protein
MIAVLSVLQEEMQSWIQSIPDHPRSLYIVPKLGPMTSAMPTCPEAVCEKTRMNLEQSIAQYHKGKTWTFPYLNPCF